MRVDVGAPRVPALWHYRGVTGGHRVLCSLLIAALILAAGLVVTQDQGPVVVLRQEFEVGGSFATAPDFRVWKMALPWYQFGEVVSNVRIYATFPF
jgi:hypothetical protein